jgi:hypothetical protein
MSADRLRLGMMPLTGAAPFVVAREKGFFAAERLEVQLVREQAWAATRSPSACWMPPRCWHRCRSSWRSGREQRRARRSPQ